MSGDLRKVSVVIPTIGRPELRDAVESALEQTAHLHEIVIGADTAGGLDLPEDSRIQVVRTGPRAGGNAARMSAIAAATGEFIALLDDDDVWRRDKLERQFQEIDRLAPRDDSWVCTTRVYEPGGRVWPQRLYQEGERIPHYLFRKNRIRAGQGAMHTSTLLFPRSLMMTVPLDSTLRTHEDTDWLIRLDRDRPDTKVIQLTEPLVSLRIGQGSASRGAGPEFSLAWVRDGMGHLDRRTRGDFLITVAYWQALRHRRGCFRVLWEAFTWGRPGLKTLPTVLMLPIKARLFER